MVNITRLQSAFTGPDVASLPVLRDDPVLVPGSLLLFEPNHPVAGWGPGVPANNATLPNAAWREAQAAIAAAPAKAATAGLFVNTAVAPSAKRTSKNSIKWKNAAGGQLGLLLPVAVLDHLRINPTHVFYVDWWGGLSNAGSSGVSGLMTAASLASDFATVSANSDFGFSATAASSATAYMSSSSNTLIGARRGSAAKAPTTGPTRTLTAAQAQAQSRAFGYINPFAPPSGGSEMIFSRFYLEDLTISGRTFAQADAAEAAMYTKHVLTAGGRYYGDDYSGTADVF